MGDVTPFPGRPAAVSSEEEGRRARDHDVLYARDALQYALPPEAVRLITGDSLLLAASAALAAVDEARHRRRFEPDYDQRRTGGELAALDRLWLGNDPPDTGGAA